MRYILSLILTILTLTCLALPAKASEFIDMDISLGKQVLARALCKKADQVNYVSRVRENVYLFSVFYAKAEAFFFVGVYKDMIKVQGKTYQKVTRSIPYHFDGLAKCGVVDYSVPDCPTTERIVACSKKTIEEELDEKFWDRPIPDLLEEDLRNALQEDEDKKAASPENDQNAETPEQ
ncbi:MAG: hypothetical protein OCC46_03390 [Pseudodesulfovibrio sp.]